MQAWRQTLCRSLVVVLPLLFVTFIVAGGKTSADILKSPNYQLQPTVGNSFGGSVGSTNYQLTNSGGEAIIGNGAGGSYKLGAGYVAQLIHGVNLYVEPSGLVGYWPMNEGAGPTVHDASANSDDGTTSGNPAWVDGKIGKALQFNSGQGLTIPGNDLPSSNITVSAWTKQSTLANWYNIVWNHWTSNSGSWSLSVDDQGSARFGIFDSSQHIASCSRNISVGSWHYLVGTYDGNTIKIYLNGRLCGRTTLSAATLYNSDNFEVNHDNPGQSVTDNVKIYNRALSRDEIEAQYEAESAGFDSGLVIPPLQSGISKTVDADVIVSADAPYSLLTSEITPLTNVDNPDVTIPSISSSIASPVAWQEGSTEGFGFTVLSGPSGVPGKWDNGANYAAVPDNATTFYDRSGFSGGAKDVVKLQYRLDVSSYQQSGRYKNNVVYTATITP